MTEGIRIFIVETLFGRFVMKKQIKTKKQMAGVLLTFEMVALMCACAAAIQGVGLLAIELGTQLDSVVVSCPNGLTASAITP